MPDPTAHTRADGEPTQPTQQAVASDSLPVLEIPSYELFANSPLGQRPPVEGAGQAIRGRSSPDGGVHTESGDTRGAATPVETRRFRIGHSTAGSQHSPIRRRTRNRRLLRFGAVLAVAIAAKLVISDIATLNRAAEESTSSYHAVIAATDLPLGHLVTDADVDVETRRGFRPEIAPLSDAATAVGSVIVVPVLAGTALQAQHLVPSVRGVGHPVPEGTRAVTINASAAPSLGVGSIVDIWATSDDPSTLLLTTQDIVSSAIILDVTPTDAVGQAFPAMLTVLVRESDVPTLVQAVASASLMLVEAPPEAACCNRSFSGSSKD